MRYTVLWVPSAQQDLAAIWIDAADRSAVASAADTIDTVLREDPYRQGESREGATRILFAPPLAIDFEVLEEDRIVRVLTVWMSESKP